MNFEEFEDKFELNDLGVLTLRKCIERYLGTFENTAKNLRNLAVLVKKNIIQRDVPMEKVIKLLKREIAEAKKELSVANKERPLVPEKAETFEKQETTIYDVDKMDGYTFEQFVKGLLSRMGYDSYLTPRSGDQGADIIATKDGIKYAVQTKRISRFHLVSNRAVQEVVAAKAFYNCDQAIVVTNSQFSASAKNLALRNNVDLWDRSQLDEYIRRMYGS